MFLFERLADEMLEGETIRFDNIVRNFVHSFASPDLTATMMGFTDIGNIGPVLALTAIACLVMWFTSERSAAILLVTSTFGAAALMWGLKLLFHRQRPMPYFGIPIPHDSSFPSGHALVSFCFYGTLATIITAGQRRRLIRVAVWIFACLMVVGIGVSRVYLGVHYPSDVLGGYLAGTVWVAGISIVHRRYRRKRFR